MLDPAPAQEIRFFDLADGPGIAYAVHGDGPLVICPAWWISHVEEDWHNDAFRRFFLQLGDGLRVVRYDRLGVGLSDKAPDAAPTFAREVAVLEALITELGTNSYSLFGLSAGGPLAAYLAGPRSTVPAISESAEPGCSPCSEE